MLTQRTGNGRGGSNGWKLAVVSAGVAAVGFNVYLYAKVQAVDGSAYVERVTLEKRIAQLEQRVAAKDAAHERTVAGLRAQLEDTQRVASTQARSEVKRHSDSTAKLLAEKQREQQEMFLGELGAVRTVSDANRQGIDAVRGDVDGVRGAIEETRKYLAQTDDVLTRTQTDVQAIAGRVDEQKLGLENLKRREEKEVTTFTLPISKVRSKVGELQMRLRDANPSKNRYTVEILADDQLILQKDRSANELVELYVTGSERPYEIVVTKVEKGRVSGFLSRPAWRQMARN